MPRNKNKTEETIDQEVQVKKKRKPRVGFTIKKDIILLRSALQNNPWQYGEDKWKEVVQELAPESKIPLTVRTVKGRINLLLDKFKHQQLEQSTGTEEELTERGTLLSEIDGIIEEENASINITIGAEDSHSIQVVDLDATTENSNKKSDEILAKSKKAERLEADEERNKLLDEAPESKKRRAKLSLEDVMIQKRQDHEMQLDLEKLKLEKDRLELERKREERLREEGERRDELSKSQLQMQTQMLAIMNKLLQK